MSDPRPLFKRGDPVVQHDDFCVSVGRVVDCGDGALRVQGEWEMRFPNPLDALRARAFDEGCREGAQTCAEACVAAARERLDYYAILDSSVGADVIAAVERAAREAGALDATSEKKAP